MTGITEKKLQDYFHLPLHAVAEMFGLSSSAIKTMCRRFGISKWPRRKLRGIEKKIASLRAELAYSMDDRSAFRSNLRKLEEEKFQ